MSQKLIFIGIDSLIWDLAEEFIKSGLMPNLERIVADGAYGYALPSMPTYTPTNWTTISTGCDPTVHGVFEWTFSSKSRRAESLWETAVKCGRRVVLIKYPGSFPTNLSNVIVVGDGAPHEGVGVLDESKLYASKKIYRYSGGLHGTFESILVEWKPAGGRLENIVCKPLEAEVTLQLKGLKPSKMYLLLYSAGGSEYDTLSIFLERDFSKASAVLHKGEWSGFIEIPFKSLNNNIIEGVCRFKLIESNPENFILYRTQIHSKEGFIYPESMVKKLIDNAGYFLDNPSRLCLAHKFFETYFEELEYHLEWIYRASLFLKREFNWDVLFVQIHVIDYIQHELWNYIDPVAPGYIKDQRCENAIKRAYVMVDDFIGKILEMADEETVIAIASDHGHIARVRTVFLVDYLSDEGFITLNNDGEIDLSKSIVREIKYDGLLLNTVWRYKDGIIAHRNEYEDFVNQIIDKLLSLKDGERHVFYVAIPGWEAEALGYGEKDIDVLYAPRPGYAIVKGTFKRYSLMRKGYVGLPDPAYGTWGGASSIHEGLPSAKISIGTNKAVLVIKGPEIKKGYHIKSCVWLRDIAPTLCALLNLPVPAQSTGRILYEVIDGKIYARIIKD